MQGKPAERSHKMELQEMTAEQIAVYNYLISQVGYTAEEATETIERHEYTVFESISNTVEYWSRVEGWSIPDGYTLDPVEMWLGNLEHDHDLLDKQPKQDLRYLDNESRAEYMHQLEYCLHESRIIYLYNQ